MQRTRKILNSNKKKKSTNANTKMAQMLEFSNKDFKPALLKMYQQTTVITRETNGKIVSAKKCQ